MHLEKEKLAGLQKSTQHLKQQQPSLKPAPVRCRWLKFVWCGLVWFHFHCFCLFCLSRSYSPLPILIALNFQRCPTKVRGKWKSTVGVWSYKVFILFSISIFLNLVVVVVATFVRVQLTTGFSPRSLYQTCPTLSPSTGTLAKQMPGHKSFMIYAKVFIDWTYG